MNSYDSRRGISSSTASAFGLTMDVTIESWPMAEPLKISGHTHLDAPVVVVTLRRLWHCGRGEATGAFYKGDTPQRLQAQIEAVRPHIETGITRLQLRRLLPPGGARNALDCALWELEAECAGNPVWKLAGLEEPRPLLTTVTVGADAPARMADLAAGRLAQARALKLKLLGDRQDADRVRAVRAARPDVWIGVDGNQGFDIAALRALLPTLEAAHVGLIEQPLPVGQDAALSSLSTSIPIAADESAQSLDDLPLVAAHFDAVNIKLDKCGGLTEALQMVDSAKRLGLKTLVGCMGGTSLAVAPALLVGQRCDLVDLDAPLFLAEDRQPSLVYQSGLVRAPAGGWGCASAGQSAGQAGGALA